MQDLRDQNPNQNPNFESPVLPQPEVPEPQPEVPEPQPEVPEPQPEAGGQQSVPVTEPQPPKKKNKLVFIIVGFLVIAGLIGGYLYFQGKGGLFRGAFFRLPSRVPSQKVAAPAPLHALEPVAPFTGEPAGVYTPEPGPQPVPGPVPGPAIEIAVPETIDLLSTVETTCFSETDYIDLKTPITRAHFAQLLVESADLDLVEPEMSTFTDVPVTDPCHKYIETLAANKIVEPYFDGSFHPTDTLKRYEVAVWVVKAFGIPFALVLGGPTFLDVPGAASYHSYVEALNSWNAVLLPRGETEFRPNDNASFGWAQTVPQVARFIKAFSRIY